jgi:hypothetical protein
MNFGASSSEFRRKYRYEKDNFEYRMYMTLRLQVGASIPVRDSPRFKTEIHEDKRNNNMTDDTA